MSEERPVSCQWHIPDEKKLTAGETVHLSRMSSLSATPSGELQGKVIYPSGAEGLIEYDPVLDKWLVVP